MSRENAECITEQCFVGIDGFGLKYFLTEELLDMFFFPTLIEALLYNQLNAHTHTHHHKDTHTHLIYSANVCH